MKAIELRKMPAHELHALLKEQFLRREELTEALARKQSKNVRELRAVKRDIARIRTVLNAPQV